MSDAWQMPRWVWFVPVGMLALVVGYTGLKLGLERMNVTETAVINHYADRYLEDHAELIGPGAQLTDCVGVPGSVGTVWIEVQCAPPGGEPAFLYGAARNGGQVYAARAGEGVPEA